MGMNKETALGLLAAGGIGIGGFALYTIQQEKQRSLYVSYWSGLVAFNKQASNTGVRTLDWYNGLPYNWWWGYTMEEFLKELPDHVLREDEPLWRNFRFSLRIALPSARANHVVLDQRRLLHPVEQI